jgi:cytochrome c
MATRTLIFSVVAWAAMTGAAQAAEPPKAWAGCAACHAAEGSAALGPTLRGVMGRKAGSVPGFAYSRAMKSAGITWDDKTLAAYIANPQQAVPGNRMSFAGLADPVEVAELVGYLGTLR